MWCITSTSTCSVGPVRNSHARSGSSPARSKTYRTACSSRPGRLASSATAMVTCGTATAASTTRWYGWPSATAKTVRSASCRPTTSRSAAISVSASSPPRSRHANGTLNNGLGPSYSFMNHNRCCANDNGSRSGRSTTRVNGVRAPVASRSDRASDWTVGFSNTVRMSSSTPSAERTRLINRVTISE